MSAKHAQVAGAHALPMRQLPKEGRLTRHAIPLSPTDARRLNQKHKPFSRDKFRAAGCKQIPGPWLRLTGETATISTWKLIGNLTYSVPLSCCHMMMRARRGVAPHATIGSSHRFRAHGRFGMSLCGLVAILGNGSSHLLALSLRLSGCRFNRQKH